MCRTAVLRLNRCSIVASSSDAGANIVPDLTLELEMPPAPFTAGDSDSTAMPVASISQRYVKRSPIMHSTRRGPPTASFE